MLHNFQVTLLMKIYKRKITRRKVQDSRIYLMGLEEVKLS
jgi:uncharacterized protein YhbP (UPF0306 family)